MVCIDQFLQVAIWLQILSWLIQIYVIFFRKLIGGKMLPQFEVATKL
jgi:hypothetical protein